jgi:hypothetical protein
MLLRFNHWGDDARQPGQAPENQSRAPGASVSQQRSGWTGFIASGSLADRAAIGNSSGNAPAKIQR